MAALRVTGAGASLQLPFVSSRYNAGIAIGAARVGFLKPSQHALSSKQLLPRRGSAISRALEQSVKDVDQGKGQQQSSDYQVREQGEAQSMGYRAFLLGANGKTLSPWHDVPLKSPLGGGEIFHFVVEIPKESSAKMEVATDEPFTPIKQDIKKGKLRFYPYNIRWNYGLLPQTWEDPNHANPEVEGALGDNDPVDVVEIGERRAGLGEILRVKPVAVLAMIDEGELDWKVIAISVDDPKAALVNDESDVEYYFPGTLTEIRDWFRDYKVPDGKPQNRFGLGNKAAGKDYALKVIQETHQAWVKLVTRSVPAGDLSLT
ncbi:soluble inorganic pyrophosphatase 6, chloroplastic [Selaginella moellendorffii]|nr:soluble inorganic pyrophosphatase 6, chloroplastic [Selaginella moellendorffii]|eukprot:XP_002961089.2 soluble inorganic pyrophosphatase 6, chloroplastic [Selaginella moellendorffii]